MEHFGLVRTLHIVAALTSGTLFLLRGIAMWRGSSIGMSAPVRWLSVSIDTVLFAAAIALATWLGLVPLVDRWQTTKLLLVLLYIVLGSLALKRAPSRGARRLCLIAALLVYFAIYSVARNHGADLWSAALHG